MGRNILCVLAGFDDKTEAVLSGMQDKLYGQGFSGVQTKGIPMHFTLGTYGTEREEELKERLEQIASTTKAFDVDFNHVGLFNLVQNHVLFIKPEISREMLDLKDRFRDSDDKFKWSSHSTLLIDKPEVIREALPLIINDFTAFEGKVSVIHLYEFWPARHILTVKLGDK